MCISTGLSGCLCLEPLSRGLFSLSDISDSGSFSLSEMSDSGSFSLSEISDSGLFPLSEISDSGSRFSLSEMSDSGITVHAFGDVGFGFTVLAFGDVGFFGLIVLGVGLKFIAVAHDFSFRFLRVHWAGFVSWYLTILFAPFSGVTGSSCRVEVLCQHCHRRLVLIEHISLLDVNALGSQSFIYVLQIHTAQV